MAMIGGNYTLQDVVTALQNLVLGVNSLATAITNGFAGVVDPNGKN